MASEDNTTAPEPQTEENEGHSNLIDGVKKTKMLREKS